MDLEETWNNYKSLLAAIASNEPNAVQNLLDEIRAPTEDAKNSVKLTHLLEMIIELQNFDVLSVLLQHGVRSKSTADVSKSTLLQHAVISGKVSLINEFLSHGVNWRVMNTWEDGNTLLHLAFMNRHEEWKSAKMYRKNLLKNKADFLIVEILKSLLTVPMDVNCLNSMNYSPLALAIKDRLKGATEFLINKGAIPIIFDNPVSHYLIKDEIKLISKPEEYGPWMRQTNMEFMDWWFSLKLDIHSRNDQGETPLQACAKPNLKQVFTTLRKYIDDVNVEDDLKQSPLHSLLESMKSMIEKHDIDKAMSFVIKLLDEGISVDKPDKNGNTPFHVAALLKTPMIMEIMLEKFTNVKGCNKMGETVLFPVLRNCSSEHSEIYMKIIRELIVKGADVKKQNNCGDTPLHVACLQNSLLNQDLVRLLVEHGSDINCENHKGATPLFTAIDSNCLTVAMLLIDLGADIYRREKETNYTTLHKATKMYQTELATKLIEAGIDVDARDSKGMTPLHLMTTLPNTMMTWQSIQLMTVLLKNFADVNARDHNNWTPLRTALDIPHYLYVGVNTLLQYGAIIRPEDKNVLKHARSSNNTSKSAVILFLYSMKIAGFDIKPFDDIVDTAKKLITGQMKTRYQKELEELKSTLIKDNVSVYDILHMDVKARLPFVREAKFKEVQNYSIGFGYQTRMFGTLMAASCWMAEVRDKLEDLARKVWPKFTDNEVLEKAMIDRIFGYLEDEDLRMFVRATKE